ncbi:HAMP domain-containing sensor histidine kinase [Paenibacillus ehimensis]|uniref:sensor histidine kinase n=1 Tax=Paenibacillus ehimensis TaxID=79264 RepID=UPI002DBB2A37|nr:HAMP domain-containing sensor histidine kinase [Paenibacillus ehimensis]MEC0210192.1 HAMP domain-containing sensor histidine kinase [Paenibacillus ehimensis]
MRIGIVLKLFLLTSALCILILTIIFGGQAVFFKQFYVHQKEEDVKTALQAYRQDYLKHAGDAQAVAKLEQDFYRKHGTWITALDAMGNLKYTDDFYMEVRLKRSTDTPALSNKTMTIPLYSVMNVEDFSKGGPFLEPFIKEGQPIAMEGIMVKNRLFPQRMGPRASNLREENRLENQQLVKKEYEVVPRFENPVKYHEKYPSALVLGTITKVQTPEGAGAARYTNHLFLERVKAFQADLLYGDYDDHSNAGRIVNYEENNVNYKMFVDRIEDPTGDPTYIFAMTSLQPVDEAAGVMQDYYVYIIIATLLLVLLASFYYSRGIARPLLRINHTTRKIADLDFSEKIPVTTKDEIGDLSRNINELSDRLHSYIAQLQQDIEKEKQLEHTRKEFISGVSHELKTPLSVIQSCLSILGDGVASHKRDHYFAAMENEVKKMDLLIVDMLDLAKYESGTYKMKMDSFAIDAVIGQVCGKLAMDIKQKQLQLHLRLSPAVVVANQHRIEQVIVNFLTNAIRHTPEREAIHVSTVESHDTVTVRVENKGASIPAEHLEKIWDRFYRAEPSRHRSTGGTGLGLAICKKILELHGVPYGVTNTADGVLFFFCLNKKV